MPTCYVIVGFPGTGKSTLIAERLNAFDAPSFTYSTDNEIERIAQTQGKTYNDVFEESVGDATKKMNTLLDQAISEKLDVIWDQTNLGSKKRKKIINRMKQAGYEVVCYCIVPPHGTFERQRHQERLKGRPGKVVPQGVIQNMEKHYEIPSEDEGFDKVTFFNMFGGKVIYR